MSPRHARRGSRSVLLSSKQLREVVGLNQDALRAAGIDPAPALLHSIATYIELLLRWNRKLNLTAITDPQEIVTRNFAESFLAVRWLPGECGRLCDVGSGAGFPGLALKLILPGWHISLLEPTVKKAAFLAEAARTLGLQGVEVERCRWEESKLAHGSLDAVTSRALGGYGELAQWARIRLRAQGKLILWLGAQAATEASAMSGWHWESAEVPGSRERVILVGTPS